MGIFSQCALIQGNFLSHEDADIDTTLERCRDRDQ